MTDWERVEQLRSKGMDWEDIAEDEKVEFTAPPGSGKPGLALKSLYFQRRSRAKRVGTTGNGKGKADTAEESPKKRRRRRNRNIALVGIAVALAGAVPYGLSFVTSLVGALGIIDYLAALALVGVALLGLALVIGGTRSLARWKAGVVLGVVCGLLVTGTVISISLAAGCPSLTSSGSKTLGDGWSYYPNGIWTQNGEPVLFFLGSAACPYCSASSWAIYGSIVNFTGSHGTGAFWATSNPNDVYPNTPEVDLSSFSDPGSGSPSTSVDVHEGADRSTIVVPNVGCPESDYVSTYDSGGSIPFVVVGGVFVHSTSLVDPGSLQVNSVAETPQTLNADLQGGCSGGSPTDACAVLDAMYYLEAVMWEADVLAHVQAPNTGAVEQNGNVQSDYYAIQAVVGT